MQLMLEISINIRFNCYLLYKGSLSFRKCKSINVLFYYSVLRVKDFVFHLLAIIFSAFPKCYHSTGLNLCIYIFLQDKFSSSVIQCMDGKICESLKDLISSTENRFVLCWNIQHRPLCSIACLPSHSTEPLGNLSLLVLKGVICTRIGREMAR